MSIPDYILKVERPKNTRVKNVNGKYKVVLRTSVRDGKRSIPLELGAIGEIVNGEYTAYTTPNIKNAAEVRQEYKNRHSDKEEANGSKKEEMEYNIKISGPVRLMNEMGEGLLQQLTTHFGIKDAKLIYVIALLRASFGELKDRDLKDEYETSMVSIMYPGVHLTEATVRKNLKRIGYNPLAMNLFGIERTKDKGLTVIDCSLLKFNSNENTYSEFSKRVFPETTKEILVITAYSPDLQELLCEEIYYREMNAFEIFSRKYKLKDAIVVVRLADYTREDFTDVISELRSRGNHYLVELENDKKEISELGLDNPCEYLSEYKEEIVLHKKVCIDNDRYLYAFKCLRLNYLEETTYINSVSEKEQFSGEKYKKIEPTFGLVVFESDLDLKPFEIYKAYDDRWKDEPSEKLKKSIIEYDTEEVFYDPIARSTVFINTISNIMGCRLIKMMKENGLSKKYSVDEILKKLRHLLEETDENGKWHFRTQVKECMEIADKFKLLE